MTAPVSETEESIWRRLVTAAAQVAGSDAAVLLIADRERTPTHRRRGRPEGRSHRTSLASTDIQPLLDIRDGGVQRIKRGRSEIADDFASLVDATIQVGRLVPRGSRPSGDPRPSLDLREPLRGRRFLAPGRAGPRRRRCSSSVARSSRPGEPDPAPDDDCRGPRSRQPGEERLRGEHEPRTPDAPDGNHRLQRPDARANHTAAETVSVPTEWVEHIHRSGQHLLGLINDVLDLAKVEAGRLDLSLERIELASAIGESIAGLRPLADRKSITLQATIEPLPIDVDRGRLRQILYNLLSNAIKFTPEGGRISVEASRGQRRGRPERDRYRCRDRARGPVAGLRGVPAGRRHRRPAAGHRPRPCSMPASRRGPRRAHRAGVDRRRWQPIHGVSPGHQRTRGPGRRRIAGRSSADPQGRANRRRRVLIIEDDLSAVRLIRTYLEADGYRVRVAIDGESGLAEARSQVPDAIILDVLLSGIDGWEVLRRLKTDELLARCPGRHRHDRR